MTIEFIDLKAQQARIKDKLDARIQAALRLLQRQAFACAGQLFLLALSIALNLRGIQS